MSDQLETSMLNDLEAFGKLQQQMLVFYKGQGWKDPFTNTIDLILEEWIINVIKHAYPEEGKFPIHLKIKIEQGQLIIRVEDEGLPFNPLVWEGADTESPIEKRKMGGLGIHIIKKIADAIHYEYKKPHNILIIRKIIPKPILNNGDHSRTN